MPNHLQSGENPAQPDSGAVVDGLILAGGRGSRLGGQDKGLLNAAGQTFAQTLVQLLRPHCRQILISCNRHQAAYQQIADIIVEDNFPDYPGPLAGLYAAASVSDADFLLVTPCDTPALDERFPKRMLMNLGPTSAPRVAVDGSRTQPLHILVPRTQLLMLDSYLSRGERSMKGWLNQFPVTEVEFADCPELFLNINTTEELQTWLQTTQETDETI